MKTSSRAQAQVAVVGFESCPLLLMIKALGLSFASGRQPFANALVTASKTLSAISRSAALCGSIPSTLLRSRYGDAAGTSNLTNVRLTRQKSALFQWLAVPLWFPPGKDSVPADSGHSVHNFAVAKSLTQSLSWAAWHSKKASRKRAFGAPAQPTQCGPIHRRARKPAYSDFLPPGATIAQRVVFGGDYEDGRRVHSAEPSSACARPDRPSRF
jgi:hypothetical protein